MKKYMILALSLILSCAMLVGCGCMSNEAEVTTRPTVTPTARPTTAPTTQATTESTQAPSTAPSSEATTDATNSTAMNGETSETAGENGIVDTEPTDKGSDSNGKSRSGMNMPPMG